MLSIGVCYHSVPHFFEKPSPVSTLKHFQNLWYLSLPHKALLYASATAMQPALHTILPPSIQERHIDWPHISITSALQDLPLFPGHFSDLHTITLWPREYRGAGYEAFKYRDHKIWAKIEELGVDVNVCYDELDYRTEWGDSDYDPFVCEIVSFLEDL
ncbi:hypothetical protein CC86DRAFT_74534 [Ophiobolus disseminans]|uniref:Uncharacterized protein n=1 Tax=Ophiobolus disseminans TaxID=1469910 RepID=A0A6A6ZQ63_9PLEO|nr:hypothetical protein CC86DRAFT_74534 [Ophiobolus disseminans]